MNIQKILRNHQLWLETNGREGERAALQGGDLRHTNLSDANLCYANLEDTKLQGACLNGANLYAASLRYADLHKTDLRRANLSDANLGEADLGEADLIDAVLSGANLSGANLTGTVLWDCIGDGTYIKNINGLHYSVAYTVDRIQIGCKNWSIEKWRNFSDEVISNMDFCASDFWEENKTKIFEEIERNPALDTGYRE